MKQLSDYTFYNSWQLNELNLKQGSDCLILEDLGDLRKGQVVSFAGFDDVDNHYGIFVFTDSTGAVLEVKGDFSGSESYKLIELKRAIKFLKDPGDRH